MAKIIKNNISYTAIPSSASMLPYDNHDSGLDATNVKAALDELAAGGTSSTLAGLADVSITSATAGQVLQYNGIEWVNANGGGGGASSLNDLSDVSIASAHNGQVLTYSNGDWINSTIPTPSIALDNISDVSIATPTNGQVLKYNNGDWINAEDSRTSVSVNQVQSVGVKIATITVDSSATDIYAPAEGTGTVTSITLQATSPISIDNSSAITTSGTRTLSHVTSGATAGSYGDSSAQTPNYSGTFKVPYVTIDTYGHITDISDHTVTIPAIPNLSALGQVSISSLTSGQVLKYNGTNWINDTISTGSTVSVTQIQSTGTKIATITVDSVDTDIYAPTGGGASALNDLSDVTITSATTGQILQYDGTDWVNAAPSGGGHTILNDSGTSLTQRSDLQFKGAYSIDNSTDSITEVNVVRSMTKAQFDLLSVAEKVGIINVTDESSPVALADISDVNLSSLTDGQILKYDSVNQEWVNANESGGSSSLSGLSDVSIASVSDGQVLKYDSATSKWVNGTGGGGGASSLGQLSDVTLTSLSAGQILKYDGSKWINDANSSSINYLSTEHVVGTWIDGSTIYEQTVLSTVYASSSVTIIYDTTSIGWDKIIDLTAIMDIYVPNEDTHYVSPLDGPANLYIGWQKKLYAKQSLASYQSGRTMNTYITFRYTKASI